MLLKASFMTSMSTCSCVYMKRCELNFCLLKEKKSLKDLKQLYFKLREKVFANPRGFDYDTDALEELLKENFGTTMCMNDVTHPK